MPKHEDPADQPPYEYDDIPGYVPIQPDHEAEHAELDALDTEDLADDTKEA